jgi:CHAT domain-containing protein/cytochrome c-type biogenesis protein CcmH/NrfG
MNPVEKVFSRQNRSNKGAQSVLKPGDRHLTEEEIERLVGGSLASDSTSTAGSGPAESAAPHLSNCVDCQRQVDLRRAANERLESLRFAAKRERGSGCPTDEEWMNLAVGIAVIDTSKSNQLLDHASGCDHCGAVLKSAYEILSRDLTPEESERLARLESAKPEWQRKLVDRLVEQPARDAFTNDNVEKRRSLSEPEAFFLRWWRLAIPTVAFVGLLIVIWLAYRPSSISEADGLLAQAYFERRLTEVRIPGAKYARIAANRGEENEPQALKDANSIIGHRLIAKPDDPDWLDAKGRAELIALHYDTAVDTLSRAANLEPSSTQIMTDLGTALYLRANGNPDRRVDFGTAIEYFSRVLAKSPDDPIALFNRALANTALDLYEPAIDDWNHYIRIDPNSDWSKEAKKKLADTQNKVKEKKRSLLTPLLNPGDARQKDSTELAQQMEGRVEEYLQLSGREWLPSAYRQNSQQGAETETLKLLGVLAQVTRDRHDDLWLTDLMNHPRGSKFDLAASHMGAGKKAIEAGNYLEGRDEASKARALFRSAGSIAGELQAETDEVYAYHLLYDGRHCVPLTQDLLRRLAPHRYRWLEAQATLELANCEYLTGDFGNARAAVKRGTNQANSFHYVGLYLRGLGFQADSAASIGDPNRGFVLASSGLDSFWSGRADLMKGYNLYTDLDTAADDLRLPNLQVAIWRQATSLIDLHPDSVQRAMAHRWFGNAAYLANQSNIAKREFERASELFRGSPQTEATARGEMDADIWLASLEARNGDSLQASERLEQVRPKLLSWPSYATELGFYTTEAELSLRRENSNETELALRSAVFLAEWALRSLRSSEDRRQWVSQTDRTYRTLVWWKIHEGDSKAALELWEWFQGAEYRIPNKEPVANGRLTSTSPPDARQAPPILVPTTVSEQLARLRGESVITYVRFDDAVAAWLYDDRGIFFHWIPAPQLEASAFQFQRLCSTRNSDLSALQATARYLYQLLIGPFEHEIEKDRVLAFELDRTLSVIPMDALLDASNHYLVEKSVLLNTPGLYQSLILRTGTAISRDSRALVVSVPVAADEGLAPLVDAERETEGVASSFSSSKRLSGSAATLSIIRLNLANSAIFHFAGHAVALPERSGLLLAQVDPETQRAAYVGAETLEANDLGMLQLAVLSACDTWPAAESLASGTEDFTKSLLRAGVPHVVASRWSVDSNQTAELMKEFYRQVLAGNGIASSLRAAQLKLASDRTSAHPYYWAAFGVQGLS